jgi:hypothetical protein
MNTIRSQSVFNDVPRKFFFEKTASNSLKENNLYLHIHELYSFFRRYLVLQNLNVSLEMNKQNYTAKNEALKKFTAVASNLVLFPDENQAFDVVIAQSCSNLYDVPLQNDINIGKDFQKRLSQKNVFSEEEFLKEYFQVLHTNFLQFNKVYCIKDTDKKSNIMKTASRFLIGNKKIESDLLIQTLCRHVDYDLPGFEELENWTIRNSPPNAVDFVLDSNISHPPTSDKYLGLLSLYLLLFDINKLKPGNNLGAIGLPYVSNENFSNLFLTVKEKNFPTIEVIHGFIANFNFYWDPAKLVDIWNFVMTVGCLFKHTNTPQKIVRARKLAVIFFEKIIFNKILDGIMKNLNIEMNKDENVKMIEILTIIISFFRFTSNHEIYLVIFDSYQENRETFLNFLIQLTSLVIQKLSEGFFRDYQILMVYLISIAESFKEFRQYIFSIPFLTAIYNDFSKNKNPQAALKVAVLLETIDFEDFAQNTEFLRLVQNILVMFIIDYKELCKVFIF